MSITGNEVVPSKIYGTGVWNFHLPEDELMSHIHPGGNMPHGQYLGFPALHNVRQGAFGDRQSSADTQHWRIGEKFNHFPNHFEITASLTHIWLYQGGANKGQMPDIGIPISFFGNRNLWKQYQPILYNWYVNEGVDMSRYLNTIGTSDLPNITIGTGTNPFWKKSK